LAFVERARLIASDLAFQKGDATGKLYLAWPEISFDWPESLIRLIPLESNTAVLSTPVNEGWLK
jgi:hypothetical protein